ncbi:MAG: hypothetical protein IT480_14060, partial [Gammaproteobacteria bacterium]|nr:hypothetical protein [Gammaproteobacteria bacterium]
MYFFLILQIDHRENTWMILRRLQAQATIDLEYAPGEELVLEDEPSGMRDFVGLAEAL